MPENFAFYIHHHGSGHFMRALAISKHLKNARVTFLGSDLEKFKKLIPAGIHCVHLPPDTAGPEDVFSRKIHSGFLHYVPLNVENVAKRAALITNTLHSLFPAILIVDVSVEVTLLATLCGIPTIVIRQNGDRNDDAHLHAYECAQLLIAPSSQILMNTASANWVDQKTYYSGGFSRHTGTACQTGEIDPNAVAVIVGSGGTSLDAHFISAFAAKCAGKTIHAIGNISINEVAARENVVFHGQLENPAALLSTCSVVIGNAGHNTIMEMADLDKKFICIPEKRPYGEQVLKAELLKKNGMAIVLPHDEIFSADWNLLINQAQELPATCWNGVINNNALSEIASMLNTQWRENFGCKS